MSEVKQEQVSEGHDPEMTDEITEHATITQDIEQNDLLHQDDLEDPLETEGVSQAKRIKTNYDMDDANLFDMPEVSGILENNCIMFLWNCA